MSEETLTPPEADGLDALTQPGGPGSDDLDASDGSGSPPPDYKAKFAASTRENQRMQDENKRYAEELNQMRSQLNQMYQYQQQQAYAQQAAQQTSRYGSDYLTDEERAAVRQARDNMDEETLDYWQTVRAERIADAKADQRIQSLMTNAQQMGTQQMLMQRLQSAPEFKDPVAQRNIAQRVQRILQDPLESSLVSGNQMLATERALMQYRAESGAGRARSATELAASRYVDMGGDGTASPVPDAPHPSNFTPSTHMSSVEREGAERLYGRDYKDPYKHWWSKLTPEQRKIRLKTGRPTSFAGSEGTKETRLWTASGRKKK